MFDTWSYGPQKLRRTFTNDALFGLRNIRPCTTDPMGSKGDTTEPLYKEPCRKQLGSLTGRPGSHYAAYTQPGS